MSIFELFNFVKDIIAEFGYLGIAFATFLEGVFPPIPSEVILLFSGFLIAEGTLNWILVLISLLLGNFASVSLVWWIGHKYGRSALEKWGKWIGVEAKEIEMGENLFKKYGYMAVFACQMVPLARTMIAFPAGLLKTNYFKYILFNTAGAAIWMNFLLYLGYTAGRNWESIENTLKPFERGILLVFILIIAYLGYKYYKYISNKRSLAN